ncbi:MAG: hypothetical protein J6A06_07085 [Fibrobacteraceae bacterium]|nr:hypothetical protein [Fibrobacteraceae bacterium]
MDSLTNAVGAMAFASEVFYALVKKIISSARVFIDFITHIVLSRVSRSFPNSSTILYLPL